MDWTIDSGLAALLGALIGGVTSWLATWSIEVRRDRRQARNLALAAASEIDASLTMVRARDWAGACQRALLAAEHGQTVQLTVHVRDDYIPNCRAAMAHAGVISRDLSVYLSRFITIVDSVVSDLKRLNDHAPGTQGSLFGSDEPQGAKEFYTSLAQLMDAGFRVGAEVVTLVDKKYPRDIKGYLGRLRVAARVLLTGEVSPHVLLNRDEAVMSEKETKGPRFGLFAWGTVAYLVVIVLGARYLGFFGDGPPLKPNEWGDVLAGVSSPLAFLWLLYASLLQRSELALQRKELRQNNETQDAQRREMEKQVEALSAQARLLEAQAVAAFDPALIVHDTAGRTTTDDFIIVTLRNSGGDILNLSFHDGATPTDVRTQTTTWETVYGVVQYLPKNGFLKIIVGNPAPSDDGPSFTVTFQRTDGVTKTNTYALRNGATRTELQPT